MGRKVLYKTEEDQLIARRKRQMKYYWKNSEIKKQEALKRYYEKRNSNANL